MVGIVAVEVEAGVGIAREGVAIGDGAEDDDVIEAGDLQGSGDGEVPLLTHNSCGYTVLND